MINIKSPQEIALMRESGRLLYNCMQELLAQVRPGVSTGQLDRIVAQYLEDAGAIPSFKGYQGFPGNICTSVNDGVVHGIPSDKEILKDGDILSVDMGAILSGWQSDMARTVAVGDITPTEQKLIDVTRESFFAGAKQAREGNRLKDISRAVEEVILANDMGIVRELVGHGIGREMHESPEIPNYTFRGPNPRLEVGMVLAIEPMVTLGSDRIKWTDDGWLVKTADGSMAAHYENTVAITENGPEILTAP
ncbi:type I methionyl aminopeptidase [Christensenella hongkongensis]|uniref:Methionine aminopeptidase n=3 Tax=Christensenella hongkongensis TaxID=270498 RepID=A0A0M2NG09_9FIRM|nr:type I methionyl aminopeptidase [Christensenella hongkongensis]KKI49372.1 Methionine aminopeptidase [Christensenella hongkongensis]KUJ28488.1 methionine aminopeptidase [Christensenella hongkongensis]TCW29987.1 methionyl aminopeptidase [Christensenella hongkongensis]